MGLEENISKSKIALHVVVVVLYWKYALDVEFLNTTVVTTVVLASKLLLFAIIILGLFIGATCILRY